MRELLKEYTVLYIEDDPNIQKNMQEYFADYFKEVYVASDGTTGLDMYRLKKPDALIVDIDLPYMDGLTLVKLIRETDEETPIIMLTAFTDKEKLLWATELKLLKYLVKPLTPVVLKETLDLLAEVLYKNAKNIYWLTEKYRWHTVDQVLFCEDEQIPLSPKERKLLTLFIQHQLQDVSFEEIMAVVWDDELDRDISLNCVKNVVSGLRKKLPDNTIQSLYGKGYILL